MNWILVGAGLVVHLIFFYSIFDIYFTSPLVHGMTPHISRLPAPAKRIVLFVADGLRADKLFELHNDGTTATPFLRSKIEFDGSWGISHTRVPTESRPGHVALIAGFYEDVSAVAKGWKENPVEFDSVFNESRHTWSWGSPDILPMFSKGASGDHVAVHMYPGHNEDFAGADMTKLDTWVFDRVQEFFQMAVENETLVQLLHQDKLVFFLHLLGLDTSGHVKKPQSREYQENMRVVDRGVEKTVKLIEEFFQHDKQTAYVFTSDHGMTDWGSHGAGHPSETLTPLVCWGAGIRSPLQSDGYASSEPQNSWQLSHIKRSDVNQADISTLMSVLIGVPIPLQSVGQVPLDYLSSSVEFKAESIFRNALQILEQFEIKMQQVQKTTLSILYTPFKRLMPSDQMNEVRTIRKLINERDYNEAINHSMHLIDLALEGLAYYHRYDRLFLGVSITAGFVGWMMYIIILLLHGHTDIVTKYGGIDATRNDMKLTCACVLAGIAITGFLYVQSLRWTYYVYTLLPVVLWHQVFQRFGVLRLFFRYVIDQKLLARVVVGALLGFLGLELIILSFFYRELLSLGLVVMSFWPLQKSFEAAKKSVTIGWTLSCILTSIFPLLPIDRSANYHFVYLAGFGAALLALLISFKTDLLTYPKRNSLELSKSKALVLAQVVVLLASVYIVWNTVLSLDNKTGLPLVNQCFSWIICGSAFVIPLLSSGRMPMRMLTIMLSLFSPYLLLSISYEGLFYLGLCVLMICWIPMEYVPQSPNIQQLLQLDFGEAARLDQPQRKLVSSDLRCAYFFIFFLLLAFFGTGNIASINTFDPTSVLCFVTVFNPFVMGALMLTKILIPLLLVTCAFNAVHLAVNVPTQSLFLLVLLMSDFMALHFFFLVKDYGSWLEIGTSISHYVVVMGMISFLFILLSISKLFTDFSLRLPSLRGMKPHKQ